MVIMNGENKKLHPRLEPLQSYDLELVHEAGSD